MLAISSVGVLIILSSSRFFLVLGLFTMVLMIATLLEGVARRTAFTLSVPRFFAVLLLYPGDRVLKVSFGLCIFFLSRYLRTLSLVCSLIFAFLAMSLACALSLPCFATFFCVISLTVCLVCLIRSVVDSRIAHLLSFTLSIIFSWFS